MKFLLRNRGDGKFYKEPDRWTKEAREALSFKTLDLLLPWARALKMQNLNVFVAADDCSALCEYWLERIPV